MKAADLKDTIRRLRKISQHLRKGKLAHRKFSVSFLNSGDLDERGCGTLGCAMGEFPAIFRGDWVFRKLSDSHMTFDNITDQRTTLVMSGRSKFSLKHVARYLGLSHRQVYHLFMPDEQAPWLYGGAELGHRATRYQVAGNIEEFTKRLRKLVKMGNTKVFRWEDGGMEWEARYER